MKKIKNLLNKIKGQLPVRKKEMSKVINSMMQVLEGFQTSSISQMQISTGILKELEAMKANKTTEKTTTADNDPAFY